MNFFSKHHTANKGNHLIDLLLFLVLLTCSIGAQAYHYQDYAERASARRLAEEIHSLRVAVAAQEPSADDSGIFTASGTPTPEVTEPVSTTAPSDYITPTTAAPTELRETDPIPTYPVYETPTPTPKLPLLTQYRSLYEYNKDVVGWLQVPGCNIDYPVVQAADNDFYLRLGLDGEYARGGTLFVDYRCDCFRPSTNQIIYGHYMYSNKTMFYYLNRYEEYTFWVENPSFRFDTIYQEAEYEIFAVFYTEIQTVESKTFKYYNFFDTDDAEKFQAYIAGAKALSLYDTGITPLFGDALVTLSTCSYHTENGRFVVMARKITSDPA